MALPKHEVLATSDGEDADQLIADELVQKSYHSLRNVARENRRRANFSDTMLTEDVLHDAFLKITGKTVWQSQAQFFRTVCLAIRQVIVDHARSKLAIKRGKNVPDAEYKEDELLLGEYQETPEQITVIDDLLNKLAQKQARLSVIVNARYFASMSETETAAALGLSERTVRRDWQVAKIWLAEHMKEQQP